MKVHLQNIYQVRTPRSLNQGHGQSSRKSLSVYPVYGWSAFDWKAISLLARHILIVNYWILHTFLLIRSDIRPTECNKYLAGRMLFGFHIHQTSLSLMPSAATMKSWLCLSYGDWWFYRKSNCTHTDKWQLNSQPSRMYVYLHLGLWGPKVCSIFLQFSHNLCS